MQNTFKDKGALLVALTDEPRQTVEPFVQSMKINYIVGFDAKATRQKYGARSYPTIFVFDRAGKLIYQGHDGADGEKALEHALK